MAQITVIGKDDLGFSPKFGQIVKGQPYTIDKQDFTAQLFEQAKPTKKVPVIPAETGGQ